MLLYYIFTHYFLHHDANNHKPKLIHTSTIFFMILTLLFYQAVLQLVPRTGVRILGYAANISVEEVARLTNDKRVAAGLNSLSINESLSSAARAKGQDMLDKDYWAHIAPDGTEPWKFFIDAGYKYKYAGENLARDFSNPSSAIEAWMASPTHRDNVLSDRYNEVGIAVVEGDMNGVDTTLIVQLFGTKLSDANVQVPIAQAQEVVATVPLSSSVSPSPQATVQPTATPLPVALASPLPKSTNPSYVSASPLGVEEEKSAGVSGILISPFSATKSTSLSIVGILLFVLTIDAVLLSKKRIARVGGRTFAHLSFLGMILAIIIILRAGSVL